MEWRPIVLTEPEANDVLRQVKLIGVKIALDRTRAVEIIDSFLKQYQECFWSIVIAEISTAIREELLKSRNVIDVKLVREVVEYLSNGGVEKKKKEEGLEEKKKEDGSDEEGLEKEEEEEEKGDSDEEGLEEEDVEEEEGSEGSGEELDDEEDSDQDLEDEEESDEDSDDDVEKWKMEVVVADEKEEIDDFNDPTTREECMEDLLLVCSRMGLIVKQGDEGEILDMMIPYIRGCPMYRKGITIFMTRVREHIDRCSTLDDLETVKNALNSSIFLEEYEDWKKEEQTITSREDDMAEAKDQVNQQLKKNMVPTKEEAIATPMNQIKQEEKRVCGDIMEIEEMETLTPLNLPEQANESTGNAYSSIKESLERGGANKRKLAQI
ncbi:hypothetical protein ABKV19_011191 [Rosa sericea]